MKSLKPILFVLVLISMSLSCNLLTPDSSSDVGDTPNDVTNLPVIDFEASAAPLNVTVQLDETATVSGMFSPNGSTMSLTAGDGTVFTLEVPANALTVDTAITMTAVKSITGAPLSSGTTVAAVQLEPSGLFFNEFVTLTVIPAQEIPIENQVIFAYEGTGQEYHLAIIDPKSRVIKIKLLEFSGAGVGSGGDQEWAANLQHQANGSRVRLQNEVAKLLQTERIDQLLGSEGNAEVRSILKSYLEKYYDQVIQKEMVAAELDCKHAEKAIQDLIGLERDNQLLGLNTDANGETIPIVDDLAGKIAKLEEIGKKCKKGYIVTGVSNEVSYSGEICSLDKPFVLNGTFANGSETQSFTPGNSTSGTVEESGDSGGCTLTGEGTYTVTLNDQGSGELQWTEAITSSCPPYSVTNTLTFNLPLNPAPDLSCP